MLADLVAAGVPWGAVMDLHPRDSEVLAAQISAVKGRDGSG